MDSSALATERLMGEERGYQYAELARKSSVQAYFLAKNDEEKDEALLIYGNTF